MQTVKASDEEYHEIVAGYLPSKRDQLIPILQDIQSRYGYIPGDSLPVIAAYLSIPVVKVNSVATFYNEFRLNQAGKFHLKICQGLGCQLDHGQALRRELERLLEIKPGETTRDQWFSYEMVPCLGVCQMAPVIMVNDKVYPSMNLDQLRRLIDELKVL